MRTRPLIIGVAAVVAVLAGVVCLFLARSSRPRVVPITIAFTTRIGSLRDDGPFPSGAKFLVTNNTAKSVYVRISTIEVRSNSVWMVQSALNIPAFRLSPHAATFTSIEPTVLPAGPWRINAVTAEELIGPNRALAAIFKLARLHNSGNPFSRKNHYYDLGYEIQSEEVPFSE
jgi:hypothetical protein